LKKLKISGKQIRRLGFESDEAVTIASQVISANYRHNQKLSALEMLKSILANPPKFKNDPIWRSLVTVLLKKTKRETGRSFMRAEPAGFRVFGREAIDMETYRQMETAMKLPVAVNGALMPDAHVGYGLPIGGVLAAYNAVIPYGVGMDIGCRMCMSVYPVSPGIIDHDRERIKKILQTETRFGRAVFNDVGDHELFERKEFREIKFLRGLKKTFIEQLGTSGHGNHFVDVGELRISEGTPHLQLAPGNYLAVLSHSGSRNFGAEICRHYTKIAQQKLGLTGEAGKLAWLNLADEDGGEYWMAMQLAGDYSRANHHFLHQRISRALALQPLLRIENHHNFAWKESLPEGRSLIIHRKGATPAGKGDVGIIPGTMASPAYIVAGKGNEDSFNSAAHGAGRVISRNKAKVTFKVADLEYYLQKSGVELLGGGLDEAPQAYKDIHEVMRAQSELVETLALFYPRIVRME
jgi:tRNA-splicing ligase RtcB